MGKVSFSGPFPTESKAQADWFVALFNSAAVRETVTVAGASGPPVSLTGTATSATVEPLKATVTSMTFFDVLVTEGTCRAASGGPSSTMSSSTCRRVGQ